MTEPLKRTADVVPAQPREGHKMTAASGTGGQDRAEAAVATTLAMLRRRVRDNQFLLSADDRVSEAHAARLLELHPDTLARKRQEGSGPVAYGLGLQRARISYRLIDLAIYIESRREKFDDMSA